MKLVHKPSCFSEIAEPICGGLLAVAAVGAVAIVLSLLYQLCIAIGFWLLLTPVAIVLLWVIGHVVGNTYWWSKIDEGRIDKCEGCGYGFRNLFSEWWHKRKCLPLLAHH